MSTNPESLIQGSILPPIFGLGPWDSAQNCSAQTDFRRALVSLSLRSRSAKISLSRPDNLSATSKSSLIGIASSKQQEVVGKQLEPSSAKLVEGIAAVVNAIE